MKWAEDAVSLRLSWQVSQSVDADADARIMVQLKTIIALYKPTFVTANGGGVKGPITKEFPSNLTRYSDGHCHGVSSITAGNVQEN